MLMLCLPFFSISQGANPKKGSLKYLNFDNGFNGITLGDSITKIPGNKLKYMDGNSRIDNDGCLKYEFTDVAMQKMLDSLNINGIGLRTYRDKIVNIYVFFKRTEGSSILSMLLANYGVFTTKPNDYQDIYNWDSSLVGLSLRYEIKVDLGVAIFTCNPLAKEIAMAKEKVASKDDAPGTSVQ